MKRLLALMMAFAFVIALNVVAQDDCSDEEQTSGYTPAIADPDMEVVDEDDDNIPNNTSVVPDSGNHTYFGTVRVGREVEHTFTIKNLATGNTSLSLTGSPIVELAGDDPDQFEVSVQPSSTSIAVSSSVTFKIKFTPDKVSYRSAIVRIENNDPDNSTSYDFKIAGFGSVLDDDDGCGMAAGQAGWLLPMVSALLSLVALRFRRK